MEESQLLADLFLYSYENDIVDELLMEGIRKLASKFNVSYCCIDDLISSNLEFHCLLFFGECCRMSVL